MIEVLSPIQRAEAYHRAFPRFPKLQADQRWLWGLWMMGNQYKGSGYHGSFPPGLLKRTMSLFPDVPLGGRRILQLFSGSLPASADYVRFDRRPELSPDVCGDAHELGLLVPHGRFSLIIADPPYTNEDAEHYGTCLIKRKVVIEQCIEIMPIGGHLVWLDQVWPMYRKRQLHCWGQIGIVRSTNHRVRLLSFFTKVGE